MCDQVYLVQMPKIAIDHKQHSTQIQHSTSADLYDNHLEICEFMLMMLIVNYKHKHKQTNINEARIFRAE